MVKCGNAPAKFEFRVECNKQKSVKSRKLWELDVTPSVTCIFSHLVVD